MRRWAMTVVVLVCGLSSGCIAAALVGAAAGGATYAWVDGKMTHTFSAPIAVVHDAAKEALEKDMSFHVTQDLPKALKARMSDATLVEIDLVYESEKVTTVIVRIGTFGDKNRSHTLLKAIEDRLGEMKPSDYPGTHK